MKIKIHEFLKQKRKALGLSAESVVGELSQKNFNIAPKTLYGYESGNRHPDADMLIALCEVYGVENLMFELGYFAKGDGGDSDALTQSEQTLIKKYRPLDDHGKEVVNAVLDIESERMKQRKQNSSKVALFPVEVDYDDCVNYEEDDEDRENVPIYLQTVSAGIGNFIDDDYFEMMSFPTSQIPYGAEFGMRISGDSMGPTISDKQIVFIKPTPQLYDGEIGIFMQDGECFCKRLEIDHENRATYLVSDNENYEKIKVNEDCRTIGKVLLKE